MSDHPATDFKTGVGERNQLTFLTVEPPPWQPGNGPGILLNGIRIPVPIGVGLATSGGYERYKEGRRYYLYASLSVYNARSFLPKRRRAFLTVAAVLREPMQGRRLALIA